MCEYNRSRHQEILKNEKPPQNQKGAIQHFINETFYDSLSALVRVLLLLDLYAFFLLSQSVYGLQNDIRTHSPTHTPAPEAKQPTEEELQEQVRSGSTGLVIKIECYTMSR